MQSTLVALLLAVVVFTSFVTNIVSDNNPQCFSYSNGNQCCNSDPKCSCFDGRRQAAPVVSTATNLAYNLVYPCRFDCLSLQDSTTNQPLFSQCANSVINYSGVNFLNTETSKFEYKCLTPDVWNSKYVASAGRLRQVVAACQAAPHSCVRATSSALSVSNINLVNTNANNYWLQQFSNMKQAYGFIRCPSSFLGLSISPAVCVNPSVLPAVFNNANSVMRQNSDGQSACPSSSRPQDCDAFLGNSVAPAPQFDDSATRAQRQQLARDVAAPAQQGLLNFNCFSTSINVLGSCLA